MKKNIIIFVMCLMTLTSWAYDAKVDGIFYNLDKENKTASVTFETTNYNSYSGSVTIPETITYDGVKYSVTGIGDNAFAVCLNLTSVTIPNTVTSIGGYGFFWCASLTSVTIPSSVKSIGDLAFNMCNSLESVNISDLTAWCNISFTNEFSNPLYTGSNRLFLNGEEIKSLVIPSTVTKILPYSFMGGSFTSVKIPDAVTSIGESAFDECLMLASVNIPESCVSIGDYALSDCAIKELTLPSSLKTIGKMALWNCHSLENIWCKAQTPPEVNDSTFSDSIFIKVKLNVPTGCTNAYKTTATWKKFLQIGECDYAGINGVMDEIRNSNGTRKYIENGQVVIKRANRKYALCGQRVN